MASCTCDEVIVSVGLDIGTTYSCAAGLAETHCEQHPDRSHAWGPYYRTKHPTLLHRDENGNLHYLKDHEALTHSDPIRYFKVFVAPDGDLDDFRERMAGAGGIENALERAKAQDASLMFRQYLEGLLNDLVKNRCPIWYQESARRQVAMTIPAVFAKSPKSLDIIEDATNHLWCKTGELVEVMYEHEAAVRAVMFREARFLQDQCSAKADIMVVDIGGMTTDAAIYSFADPSNAGLSWNESAFQGALLLDASFERELNLKFERQDPSYMHSDMSFHMLREWEAAKRRFDCDNYEDDHWVFRDPLTGLEDEFSTSDLVPIFRQFAENNAGVIAHWWEKACEQKRSPEVIFITGGIVQNQSVQKLLRKCLMQKIPFSYRPDHFEVLFSGRSSLESWNGIALGATLKRKDLSELFQTARGKSRV